MKKIRKTLLLTLSLALSATLFTACDALGGLLGVPQTSEPTQSESTVEGEGTSEDVGTSEEPGTSEVPSTSEEPGTSEVPGTSEDELCEHTGGNATCTSKAVCELCGEEYGDFAEHSYTELKYDATNHWYECACGDKKADSEVAHSGGQATCTAQAVCEVCEQAYGELLEHSYTELKYNETNHWYECACGDKKADSEVAHSGGQATCTAQAVCEVCEQAYGELLEHSYTELKYNATNHWYECACGDKKADSEVAHSGGQATCAAQAVCEVCEQAYGELLEHSYTELKSNETNHWYECACGDKKADSEVAHSYTTFAYEGEKHWKVCDCGAKGPEESAHAYDDDYDNTCDCGYKREIVMELDDVVGFSVADGKFTVPASVVGTVTGVSLEGVSIFTGVQDGVVTFNTEAIEKVYTAHGLGKNLTITTEAVKFVLKADVITKVITTAKELQALGVGGGVKGDHANYTEEGVLYGNGNSWKEGNDVYGYYVLGGNIDATGMYFSAGYSGQKSWFQGTFDGRGYTVSNVIVSEGGIFGGMKNATIRNVNFTGVRYHDNSKAGQGYNNNKQWGQYFGLLGQIAWNINVENIDVQVSEISTPNFAMGVLVFRPYDKSTNTFKNINVDASGLMFENVLTTHTNDGTFVYENVTIKAADYKTIALVGEKNSEVITSWPAGVTFNVVGKASHNDNSDLPLYEGDVTALGFEMGTAVRKATISDGWSSRAIVSISTKFDYVDIEFAIGEGHNVGSLCVWDGLTGNYNVTPAGGAALSGAAERTIQVFDANGAAITAFAANTRYILRVYTENVKNLQVSTFDSPAILYFGNVTYGKAVKLDTVVDIDVASGSFTLPTEVDGEVTQVIIGGIVSKKIEGDKVFVSEAFADKTSHGVGMDMVICTEEYTYTCKANVITKVIKTAEELKALGVGNNRTNTEDILGYYVLGNDITFEHADDYSDVVTAGYPANGDYYFKATFDGRGYTLYNMRVSDGGIFGLMRSGTVKNVNLKNVYLTDDIPEGISTQNGGYMAIFAFSAPTSVFENINITIASSPNAWSWKRDGLIVNSSSWGSATYRNITIDATGLKLKTLLGTNHSANNVYENVVITAADYVAIGYTADSLSNGVQNTAALMTEFPAGVTFKAAGKVFFNDGSDLPLYEGDVTAIGFEKGTTVRTATITDGWSSRAKVSISTKYDYVDIQFVIGEGHAVGSLCVWDGSPGDYSVTPTSTTARNGAPERTIQIFDANGEAITAFAKNTLYILRIYTENVSNLQVSTFSYTADSPAILYFGNVTYGNAAN